MSHPYARTKVTAVGAAAASLDLSGKAKEIVLSSTTDCWINFNDAAVANSGLYLPADKPILLPVLYKESVSVIQDAGGGYLSILELGDVVLITTVHKFFTSDASLKSVEATTIKGNASILRVVAETATGDASLLKAISATMTGDAYFDYPRITSDASLLRVISSTITGNASLLKVSSTTVTGDASLLKVVSATMTVDASLLKTESATFTGDATTTAP